MHVNNMTGMGGCSTNCANGCCVAALVVVAGMALGGCGVAKCVKYLVNKDKSKQAKEVVVSSNQSVMGSDTIRLNAVAMNQHTK